LYYTLHCTSSTSDKKTIKNSVLGESPGITKYSVKRQLSRERERERERFLSMLNIFVHFVIFEFVTVLLVSLF